MSNDYNDKSWTERTNWIVTVIALALVAILSIGLLCALFIQPQEKEERVHACRERCADDSHTYFNNHGSGGSMGSYSATYVDEVENAIGKTFSFDNHMFEPYNFRHESGSFVSGEMTKNTTYYKDLSGEELAERYLMTDKGTVLWRVVASVEGKYGSYTREDSYLMYSWPAAGIMQTFPSRKTMKLSVISERAVKVVISLTDARFAVVYCSATDAEFGADFGLHHSVHVTIQNGKFQCG